MSTRNTKAVVLAIAAVIAQNMSTYLPWQEMWTYQRAWVVVSIALIVVALLIAVRGNDG